jgi:hypothetical protein
MTNEPLLQLELPGIQKVKTGKVREVFDLGEHLLFVATDRISAFDCVMPNGIPRKGEVLSQPFGVQSHRCAATSIGLACLKTGGAEHDRQKDQALGH